MMSPPNWVDGTGYPEQGADLDVWEHAFLSRGAHGLRERPYFPNADGSVEFFVGPSILQIEDDGSLHVGPDKSRSSASRMIIEFQLDQDIDAQLAKARKWLVGNQRHRYVDEKRRLRESKYKTYLRALDGLRAGKSLDEIAAVLYPHLSNSYPDHLGRKQVSKDIASAKRLSKRGFRPPMNRK